MIMMLPDLQYNIVEASSRWLWREKISHGEVRSVLHCTLEFLWMCLHWQVEHWPKQSLELGLNCGSQAVHPHPWSWVCSPNPGTKWLHQPLVLLRLVHVADTSTLRSMLRDSMSLSFLPALLRISPQICAWHRLYSKQVRLGASWSLWMDLGAYPSAKGAMSCAVTGKMHRALGHQKPFQTWYRSVKKGLWSGKLLHFFPRFPLG